MKFSRHPQAIMAGWTLTALTGISLANQLPGDLISGQVTAVAGNTSIKIDSKVYRIKSGSPAAQAATTVKPGQVIDAQLNGPANSSATEVVNLVTHSGR